MRRIDDETREAIAAMAEELDAEGWVVSRRAIAREFGVSPQTVARVLDGPNARRVATATSATDSSSPMVGLGLAALAALAALTVWLFGRRSG